MIWLGTKKIDLSLVKHVRIRVIDIIDFYQNLSTKEKEGLCEEERGLLATSSKNL